MKEIDILQTAVLVNVDDNEPARYVRSRILQRAGFTVHDAATGGEGLRLVEELQPDLVLLDVNLPDVHGIEVCRRIKHREESVGVIVLQISASAISAPQATAALNTGADSYLIEPIDPDVLVATVRAFLRLRGAERGLARANQELSEKNAELHALNQALRRSNEDLEHFAYLASHDLQEPLRTICAHLQLVGRIAGDRLKESERELFAFAVDAAARMSMLIRDVLAYSRIGKEVPTLKPTRLDDAVAWAVESLKEAIAACEAKVVIDDLPVVAGDCLQLSQVFQNLIGNAIKYRSPGVPANINVSANLEAEGDWVIAVRDNGIGISEKYLDTVFRPFKRLHGREIPGNGIGLALCRRIIERHGGHIWVQSREGEGSSFFFTLSRAETAVAAG